MSLDLAAALCVADVIIAMEVMMEETFGPVIGIMKVENDEEALTLMNDSPYGLVRCDLSLGLGSAVAKSTYTR